MCVNEEIYQDNPDCLIKRKSKKNERDKKKKSIEGGSVCVNEEIYQDNPRRPNFPNYPQAVCPQDLDQEIQK